MLALLSPGMKATKTRVALGRIALNEATFRACFGVTSIEKSCARSTICRALSPVFASIVRDIVPSISNVSSIGAVARRSRAL